MTVPYCLTPLGQSIALRFWPLARHIARQFVRVYPSLETEIQTAAVLALIEAAAKCKGLRDETAGYFGAVIQRRLCDQARDYHTQKRDRRREINLGSHDFSVMLPDFDDSTEWMLGLVKPDEAAMIRAMILDGETSVEASERLDVHRDSAKRLLRNGLGRLREHPRVKALAGVA